MLLVDTHAHIFLDEFDPDRASVIQNALEQHIRKIVLPNIDSTSIDKLLRLSRQYPEICYPMIGLHPTSVKENYLDELKLLKDYLEKEKFYGIGETGLDLYWDKTFLNEQEEAFKFQIDLAKKYRLPLIIHVRDSFNEVFNIIDQMNDSDLFGIFHCFSGTIEQARHIIEYGGFKLGIGGVLTFKNSGLQEVVSKLNLEHLVLETDSPYLAPVPQRGMRNESSYIQIIAKKLAEIKNTTIEEVALLTSENANQLFKFI